MPSVENQPFTEYRHAECHYAECHYAVCHYGARHYAFPTTIKKHNSQYEDFQHSNKKRKSQHYGSHVTLSVLYAECHYAECR